MKTFEVCKIFRRGFVVVVVSFAAALLCAADVRAEQPGVTQKWPAEKILPPEPGRKACWRRVYDAKHLAAHPQQKITELTFFCVFRAMTLAVPMSLKTRTTFSTISPFR